MVLHLVEIQVMILLLVVLERFLQRGVGTVLIFLKIITPINREGMTLEYLQIPWSFDRMIHVVMIHQAMLHMLEGMHAIITARPSTHMLSILKFSMYGTLQGRVMFIG